MPSGVIRALFIFLALWISLLALACSTETVKSLRDLNRLRQQLIDRYQEPDISANQNSRFLFIAFVNSPLNQKNSIDRARRAQETARFAVSNYPAIKGIESIAISFVESESRFFIYRYTRNLGFFLLTETASPKIPVGLRKIHEGPCFDSTPPETKPTSALRGYSSKAIRTRA